MKTTGQVSRSTRRKAVRAAATQAPSYIRSMGSALDADHEEYLRRKLARMLAKFGPAVERTSVRLQDVNGPRGGIDKRCQVKVVLGGLPSVYVDERHRSVRAAMDRALARAEHAVRQALQRQRTRPRKRRSRAHAFTETKVNGQYF
jgi:putative sigma-54 modulation protein